MRAFRGWVARAILAAGFIFGLGGAFSGAADVAPANAQESQWIWSPAVQDAAAPGGVCYFRRIFDMTQPESGEVQITADESYELFVNGRSVGSGKNWRMMDVYDVTKYLVVGRNVIAIKATKTGAGPAGVAARAVVKSTGDTFVGFLTNDKWKTSQKEFLHWTSAEFSDAQWVPAHVIGQLGVVKPWLDEVQTAGGSVAGRFNVAKGFHVEPVTAPTETGSLLSIAFNEFGEILAARENGPLLMLRGAKNHGSPDKASVYCDQVKNIQGILPLNGQVYVVGAGSEGTGLYRISDTDAKSAANNDAVPKKVDLLIKFSGDMTEHGPHVPVLGPDGLIYVLIGDHTKPEKGDNAGSPHHDYYEGDLLQPRYEDPNGYGVGVKAPGGRILRTDVNGSVVENFAGGFRNPYGFAFNAAGELFTQDSDMEWDVGLPWYRPTRVLHVVPGGEYGWRSGWAAWPSYFFDSLPGISNTGRGSPTGLVAYNHVTFPRRYHDSLFVGDWAHGRILNVRLKPDGAGYSATTNVFLEGKPLNITGLAVGPDGSLYFCTGGRDTEGGVYRVVWNGTTPPELTRPGEGIEAAIRQQQLDRAWARQRVASIKQELGDKWDKQIGAIADDAKRTPKAHCRALDLMQMVGPFPTTAQLRIISYDADTKLRAKAAYLMGLHADASTQKRLIALLKDGDPLVERIACESLVRAGQQASWAELVPLLKSKDRYLAWAATRALERMPADGWQEQALKADNARTFLQGSLALLVMAPERGTVDAIFARVDKLLAGYLNDADFLDLLRVTELALERGKLCGDDIPSLRKKLAKEYPSADRNMNRELIRLLAFLQDKTVGPRMMAQLDSDLPLEDKLHLALYAHFMPNWNTKQKLALLKFYETARTYPGGHSYTGYIENVSRDLFGELTESERKLVLNGGEKWPSSALSVLAKLPDHPDAETLCEVEDLDRRLEKLDSEAARKLKIGIVAVLGHSGDSLAMAYLRELYEKDPERRGYIAMSLAEHPEGENWELLVRSLTLVESTFAQEVLAKLATVDRKPEASEPYRQAILRGLKLQDAGGLLAVRLLEKWTGKTLGQSDDKWDVALAAWQQWFAESYPDQPEAKLPQDSNVNRWTYEELFSYLNSKEGLAGNPARGSRVHEGFVHSVPSIRGQRRGGRPGPHHGQPAVPKERNPRIDPLPVAGDLRSVREQIGVAHRRPRSLGHRRSAGGRLASRNHRDRRAGEGAEGSDRHDLAHQEIRHARGAAEWAFAGRDRGLVRVSQSLAGTAGPSAESDKSAAAETQSSELTLGWSCGGLRWNRCCGRIAVRLATAVAKVAAGFFQRPPFVGCQTRFSLAADLREDLIDCAAANSYRGQDRRDPRTRRHRHVRAAAVARASGTIARWEPTRTASNAFESRRSRKRRRPDAPCSRPFPPGTIRRR